jgi:hypothetical protein
MKATVLWDVAPCSLVKVTDVSEVLTASIHSPDDGGSKKLCNAVSFYESTRHNRPEASLLRTSVLMKRKLT